MATPSSSRPTSGSPVQATATGSRLRADAEVLAAVYQLLRAREAVPLDRSAEPPKVVPHGALNVKSPLLTAITDVVEGDDSHAKRRIYSAAYWAVIPKVSETAAQVAASALDKQFRELVKLEQRIRQPNVAQRLHDIAVNVVRRLGGLSVTNKDYENARVHTGPGRKNGTGGISPRLATAVAQGPG